MAVYDGMAAVRLVGAVRYHHDKAPGAGRHRRATTLAIHMDRKAAIDLAASILALARSMGWPLPLEGESQA
jgi:hypothetical protein